MHRHIAIIVNPYSGGERAKTVLPEIKLALQRRDLSYDLLLTERHNHAIELASQLDPGKYDALVAVGGDGTNFQMLNGLLGMYPDVELPPLGVIPIGSGNSFALDLEIQNIDQGIARVVDGETRPVDVCYFTQGDTRHYFVNLMGFGFVTDVAATAAKFKKFGDMSYIIGVLHRTVGLTFHQLEMELDGELIRAENCFVEFCNSRFTGGNMCIAPNAKIDDGYFDVVVLGNLSRRSLLRTFPKIFKGTHGENPAVQFFRGKRATVRTTPEKQLLPDGELFGSTPTEVGILPQRVRYLA
ncbi:MAG: diacylglycerol kinase family lipid kinase [Lentisphaeria bacterium]|nr:diacylglycerol kinase family lipid kinase [Candidatus Neomarinimicrobiota bacterium]MCF7841905.1 diacylglycerol kinase family lipid kinase [Lentisphaeria bacterium]